MRKIVGGVAAMALLLAGCGSSETPAAQTVTSTATALVTMTESAVETVRETETEEVTSVSDHTATVTAVKTVTFDPVAASKSKAAASSKASVAAEQKKGAEGYAAQLKAAGIPSEIHDEIYGTIDVSDPVAACKNLDAGKEPFDYSSYASDLDWETYFAIRDQKVIAALKLVVKNVCPKYQPKVDEQVKAVAAQSSQQAAADAQEKHDEQLAKEHKFADGTSQEYGNATYLIPSELVPGTYQTTTAKVTSCYWELADSSGNIIDNNFVNGAPQFTVHVSSSASAFNINGCDFEWIGD